MLDFLDRLCAALLARRSLEAQALLKHPLARALPQAVLEEGLAIATAPLGSTRAPVVTLHFYYQTMQLLATGSEPVRVTVNTEARPASTPRGTPHRGVRTQEPQLELALRALAS